MRVLFVVESATDVRLVDGLAERHEVSLLVRRLDGGHEVSQPLRRSVPIELGPGGRLAFARRVAQRVRAEPVDVVLVQGYALAALGANLAGRRRRVRMLVCSPAEAYYRCRRGADDPDRPYRARELVLVRMVAALNRWFGQGYIVLGQHLADEVGSARRPVAIAPVYGVDVDVFSPAAETRSVQRARLGLPDGPLALFSSRIAPEKDAATLLEALRLLRDRGRPVRLLHRSGGHEAFLAAARARGVDDLVIATDAVDPRTALAADYRAVDVCVQASRAEGLGFSPLEALACGTPVVATAVGGLRETIVPGETGWTYPVGDAAALADAIEAVVTDPTEAARRAAAGRAMVLDRFARDIAFDALDLALSD